MKNILKLLLIACLCHFNAAMASQNGSYIGGLLGHTDADYSISTAASTDDSGLGYRVQTGYQFNPNFALEMGFNYYQTVDFKRIAGVSAASATVHTESLDLLGKLIMPITSGASIFAKGGLAYAQARGSSNSVAKTLGVGISDEHSFRPIYGLGASYEFYPNLTAELSWLQIPEGGGIKQTDIVAGGITYFFG